MTDMTIDTNVDRRGLIRGGALASCAISVPLTGLMTQQAAAATTNAQGAQVALEPSPYGALAPVADGATGLPLLQLPRGFTYRSFGWFGDIMSDGQPTPSWQDGMAVVSSGSGRNGIDVLIRNHEYRSNGAKFFVKDPNNLNNKLAAANYDQAVGPVGGCTAIRVQAGRVLDDRAVIGETDTNCAGGATPWGTWLTCEETLAGNDNNPNFGKTHGWVFEVSPDPTKTIAEPIWDMGRRAHEAVAVDPKTGDVYLTEDATRVNTLYRFRPNDTSREYGALGKGGVLEALKVVGVDKADLHELNGNGGRTSNVEFVGQSFVCEWVRILNPSAAPTAYVEAKPGTQAINGTVAGSFAQARDAGAARFTRGEGAWWSRQDDGVYIVDTSFNTSGGVYLYRPDRSNPARGTLTLIYAAANRVTGNQPDNITVSPRGGLMLMEDGNSSAPQRLLGLTNQGFTYEFCRNNINLTAAQVAAAGKTAVHAADSRFSEFAGGCFSADGRTFYVNVQTPGVTFAITGPWARGNL